jgi:hypothetical protein
MKTWINILFLLIFLLVVGCSEGMKETKLKCVKCGAYFSTKEGADEFNKMLYPPR